METVAAAAAAAAAATDDGGKAADEGAASDGQGGYASQWGVDGWVQEAVCEVMLAQLRSEKARKHQLGFLKGMSKGELAMKLSECKMLGLLDILWDGAQQLEAL